MGRDASSRAASISGQLASRPKGAGSLFVGGGARIMRHPPCAVHVVTGENRNLYHQEIEASFRLRHDVYVTERKWNAFLSPDGREVDRYDGSNAIYLLAIENESGRLVGCARLTPTDKQTPLKEFPEIAKNWTLPRSPFIYHYSRYVVARERRDGSYVNSVGVALRCAVQEFALSEDIEQLTALIPVSMLPALLELGWNPHPLGLPAVYRGMSVVGVTLDVSEIALARTRSLGEVAGPVLIRKGLTRPAISATRPARIC